MTRVQQTRAELIEAVRASIGRIERGGRAIASRRFVCEAAGGGATGGQNRTGLAFGHPDLDGHLPGRLALGALHEVAGAGPDTEHGAAAALFAAGVLARSRGPVLWALTRRDLFAPALAGAGLHPGRVLYAEAGRPAAVLLVMEEGLRHPGLAGVVGELSGRLSLTASRRLQLAAEAAGTLAILLRRSRRHDDPVLSEPSAAVTRWRVAALPSPPPLLHAPDTPGLGRARWRLDLVRARGAEPRTWLVEACDAQGRLGVAADVEHGQAAPAAARYAAG